MIHRAEGNPGYGLEKAGGLPATSSHARLRAKAANNRPGTCLPAGVMLKCAAAIGLAVGEVFLRHRELRRCHGAGQSGSVISNDTWFNGLGWSPQMSRRQGSRGLGQPQRDKAATVRLPRKLLRRRGYGRLGSSQTKLRSHGCNTVHFVAAYQGHATLPRKLN